MKNWDKECISILAVQKVIPLYREKKKLPVSMLVDHCLGLKRLYLLYKTLT